MLHVNTALLNGSISPEVLNLVVSPEILKNILLWQRAGATMDDVLRRLRLHTVPTGYTPTTCTLVCPVACIIFRMLSREMGTERTKAPNFLK